MRRAALLAVLLLSLVGLAFTRGQGLPTPFDILRFSTEENDAPLLQGECRWSYDDATLECGSDVSGTVYQYGQEQLTKVVNKTGDTLANGTVVYIDGAQGNRPTVTKSDADSDDTTHCTIGLVTNAIEDNAEGYVTTGGLVRDLVLPTATYTAGDRLFVSQTAGEFTKTAPTHPAHVACVGYVVTAHETQGVIFVRVRSGFESTELHDVEETDPTASGGVLVYNSASGVYIHKASPLDTEGVTPHAEMYAHDNATATPVAATGTYVHVTQGATAGELSAGWSHSGGTLTASSAAYGVYYLTSAQSFSGGANTEYQFSIFLDGVEANECHNARKVGSGGDIGSAAISCLLTIGAGADDVTLRVEDVSVTAADITARFWNVSLLRVSQ